MMPWYWLVGQQVLREAVVRRQRLEAGTAEHPGALARAHEVAFAATEVFEAEERQGQQLDLGEQSAPT
jgi:hypothetical protein